MLCERYDAELTEVALGDAPSAGLTAHLEGCAGCRARLEGERRLALAIDGGLREVLAAAPSPQFLGEVRRRVASERARPRRVAVPGWISLAAMLAIATALGLLHVLPRRPETPAPPVAAAPGTPAAATTVPAAPVAPRLTTTGRPVPVRPANRPAARPSLRREPEVLVAPGQAEALARFVDALRQRRVEPSSVLARPFAAAAALPEPADISFRPVELKPLAVSEPTVSDNERSSS